MPDTRRPLRLWPGVVLVILQWLARFGVPAVAPDATAFAMLGALAGALAIIVWWVFFSRAPWLERLGALVLMGVAAPVTRPLLHESLATAGQGILFYVYVVPVLCLALVLWAWLSRGLSDGTRRLALVATVAVACGMWTLVRMSGVSGTGTDFAWRWSATPEERLLAREETRAAALPPSAAALSEPEWPGFRGSARDSVIPGVRIDTDWSRSSPVELWRRPVGPGWSSFAVHGDLIYTQEQRGEEEVVACYRIATGEPVWKHRDPVRFWEANAGAGPRGTPTLHGGRVYTFGATGILNVLEAGDGTRVWSRDVSADTGVEVPYWGFSSSPLVVEDVVIVAAEGRLAAYDVATGEPRWQGPEGGPGYSSPHLYTIDGVAQVVLQSGTGVLSVAPADGTELWKLSWEGYPIVQPARAADGDLLVSASREDGLRRLSVTQGSGGWTTEELWTTTRFKPYFNDFVVHEGHAYGFDGTVLACLDLANGARKWKGGRYGQGQLVLLADQGLLLVLSERGELALVGATPDGFSELARVPAIEGKTWNHPVLVGDLLLVRNDEEMAAFRLRPAPR